MNAPPSLKLIVPCIRTYFSAFLLYAFLAKYMAERLTVSFPMRAISDSSMEVTAHVQHVPARYWSFTLVAGRRTMSVN